MKTEKTETSILHYKTKHNLIDLIVFKITRHDCVK